MKNIYRFICLMLTLVMVLSLGGFSAFASLPPLDYDRGDVNMDDTIDIRDATLIQKYHAGLVEFTKEQIAVSDFDMDNRYTVKDATRIQKYEVGLVEIDNLNDFKVWQDMWFQGLYANYDSGKAMVGVPVTFFANTFAEPAPMTLEFKINGEVVFERGEATTWEYTFENAGEYEIEVILYNLFDWTRSVTLNYVVVEPYETDELMFTGIALDAIHPDDLREMTAYAFVTGGTAPYKYNFEILGTDYFGEVKLAESGFSEADSFSFGGADHLRQGEYTLVVTVRDSAGSAITQNYSLIVEGALIG